MRYKVLDKFANSLPVRPRKSLDDFKAQVQIRERGDRGLDCDHGIIRGWLRGGKCGKLRPAFPAVQP